MSFDRNLFEYFESAIDYGLGPAHSAEPAVNCVIGEVETNGLW